MIASGAVVLVVLVIVQSVSARARQAQDENLDTVDSSAESPVEVSRPERSPSSRAMVLAFDPSTQRWSGEDIFEIEQNLEIENGVLNFGRSEASGFEAQLIAEYPGRRVYRLPELGVLMETDWSLGVDDMLTEPILRRISTGALIAKLNIMSASLNRSNGLIAGVSKTDKNLLQVFNANDGRLERTIHIPQLGDEEPLRVDFAPDGLHLFVATYENSWMSVRIEDGQAEWKIKLSSEEWLFNLDVSFDQTGESALLFSGDDRPQRCALGMVSCSGPLLSPPYELTSMAPHPNRESALYGTHNGVICLGRLDGDPEHFCFGDRWGDAVSPAPHHSGRYVAAVFYDRGVVIYRFGKTLAGGNDRAAMEGLSNRIRTGIGPSRAALRQTNGSDTGALRDQTEVNVL